MTYGTDDGSCYTLNAAADIFREYLLWYWTAVLSQRRSEDSLKIIVRAAELECGINF